MTLQIGITGHQERDGIEWSWVKKIISIELSKISNRKRAITSLAVGSDQVFAQVALELGIPILAVIPLATYEQQFKGSDIEHYRQLLRKCEVMQLNSPGTTEQAFFEAGRKIVEMSDLMFAVWDGNQAEGLGGTGDIVKLAMQLAKPVLHINPIVQTVGLVGVVE